VIVERPENAQQKLGFLRNVKTNKISNNRIPLLVLLIKNNCGENNCEDYQIKKIHKNDI
jgi:hypothetical protein